MAPATLWPNLAAGFLLALAVRIALASGPAPLGLQAAVAAVLGCALLAHSRRPTESLGALIAPMIVAPSTA